MFIQKSMFSYKAGIEKIDAFFMRRSNFRKLLEQAADLSNIHQSLVKFILLDYI